MRLLVLAVLLQVCLVRADVPGSFVNLTQLGMQPTSLSTGMCDGHQYESICAVGMPCEYVMVCLGSTLEIRSCLRTNPDKPYCNKGQCSEEPEFNPFCMPQQIYCTSEGWFPDPYACSLYHSCESAHQTSDVYQCPSGYVFNPETTICKKKQSDADCTKIVCTEDTTLTAFGNSKKYFAFCNVIGGRFYNLMMYQCPKKMEFNGKTCVFKCPAAGRFPMVSNPKVYYECAAVGEDGVAVVCEEELVYDVVAQACI